jgi:hypothetical protein
MDIRFCPNCGAGRRDGAVYCVACGNRLSEDIPSTSVDSDDIFAIPPMLGGSVRIPSGGGSPSATNVVLLVARIVTALSPLLAVLYFDDLWLIGSELREIWIISVWIPAMMTVIPLLGSRRFLGISGDDARFVFLSAITAFFVALRSVGAMLEPAMPSDGLFVFSQVLGLAGFVVVGVSFPWKKPLRTWFAVNYNPVHITIATVAAIVFLVMRERDVLQFLFSPASISGPSVLEYIFLALLVAVGFLRAPWRQFAALPIASFSILSFIANVLFVGGPLRPWPNPVTFACCIALCFPWESAVDDTRVSF